MKNYSTVPYPNQGFFVNNAPPPFPPGRYEKGWKFAGKYAIINTAFSVIGPAEASVKKISDSYRRMIYVKSADYNTLTMCKDRLEQYIETDEIKEIRVQLDFDPMNSY